MTDALAIQQEDALIAAQAAIKGDLARLTEPQKVQLYGAICKSVGLNPLTSPFELLKLNGKEILYAKKGATDQLRAINGVNIVSVTKEIVEGILTVTVEAVDKHGRHDMEIGAVNIGGLRGEALANAHMKALTKAKRRVTLSIAGLGFLDESEVETIPGAQPIGLPEDASPSARQTPTPLPKTEKPQWAREVENDPYRLSAMRRLHAIGDSHGVNHDMLHAYALTQNKASLSQYSNEELLALATEIDVTEIAPLKEMFGDFGWSAPQWMVHRAVTDSVATAPRTVDTETGEIIDIPLDPIAAEEERAKAKGALWQAVKGWGWSLEDLKAFAAHNTGKPLGDMTSAEYEGLRVWLDESTPEERAEELANARTASGKAA